MLEETRTKRPNRELLIGLAIAGVLWLLPGSMTEPFRAHVRLALVPGQQFVHRLGTAAAACGDRVGRFAAAFGERRETAARLARLQEENRRLAAQVEILAAARPVAVGEPVAGGEEDAKDGHVPLLHTDSIRARVLGLAARAYLVRRHLLCSEESGPLRPEAWVVAVPPGLIDGGVDLGLSPGKLVLAHGRLWGKVDAVGPHTATVATIIDAGYRDLVVIVSPEAADRALARGAAAPGKRGESPLRGPRGILEGTGEATARLRHVDATEPVSPGDLVYTLSGQGVLDEPLLCGEVVRAALAPGATQWDIRVRPVIDAHALDEVWVVQPVVARGH